MSTTDARPWARTLDEDARRALDRFDAAIDAALEPYLDRLSGSEPRRGKAVHDLVWGFVEFTPGEIAIIDSPLVQRLRFIRQLGLAHLLFPAAGYSRFEHSLGSCFVIGRLFQSLHAHAIEDDVAPPSSLDLRLLRHAALLHDVGHCAFSHASERVWESPEFTCAPPRRWAEALASHLELQEEKPSIAEAMTVVALTSPASARLLEISLALDRVQTSILDWISDLARIVCGATLPGMRSGLASLMSGSMDADRMDYLARDSVVSGVNLTGDLRRLMTKMRLRPDGRRGTSTIVLEASGQQALSDLLLSREILTQRIYRHPKTIAAEGLLENALRLAARLHPSLLDPSTLFWLGDDVLLDRLSCSPAALEAPEATRALQHLVRAILWRDLPKRALIARPRDLPPGEDRERLRDLCFTLQTPSRRAALSNSIAAEFLRGSEEPWSKVEREILTQSIIVGITPPSRTSTTEVASGPETLATLHREHHECVYVFAPPPHAATVHRAARKVLLESTGVALGDSSAVQRKLDASRVDTASALPVSVGKVPR